MAVYTQENPDPDVRDVFKYCISKGGAGLPHDDQIFTTWFYGAPDCTYITDWIYFLDILAEDEAHYPVEALRQMVRFWFTQPSFFADYCGLNKQYSFVHRLDLMMDTLTKDELMQVLNSLRVYIGCLNAWIYQYFPWGVGNALHTKDKAYYEAGLALCTAE